MIKDTYKLKYADKIDGGKVTAADFNQMKSQHNILTDISYSSAQVENSTGISPVKTISQGATTKALNTKLGLDHSVSGLGQNADKILNSIAAKAALDTTADYIDMMDGSYFDRSLLHPKLSTAPMVKQVIVSSVRPAVKPDFIGQEYVVVGGAIYKAVGTSSAADFVVVAS